MSRLRKHELLVRKPLGVRVPKWIIDELDQRGNRTEVTERALLQYIKNYQIVKK